MTTLFLLIPLAALFLVAGRQASMLDISKRTERFSRGLALLLRFMPVLAAVLFAVLLKALFLRVKRLLNREFIC